MELLNYTEFPDWSWLLFQTDMQNFPINFNDCVVEVQNAYKNNYTYRQFFQRTRGFHRPGVSSPEHETIWDMLNNPTILYHFERYLVEVVDKPNLTADDRYILSYLKVLSKTDINQWDDVVQGMGACCFEFFATDPYKYCELLKDDDRRRVDNMSDQQLLGIIEQKLYGHQYDGHISRQNNRSDLLLMVQDKYKLIDI